MHEWIGEVLQELERGSEWNKGELWWITACATFLVGCLNVENSYNFEVVGKFKIIFTVLQIQVYPENNAPGVSKPMRVAKSDFLLILKIFLTLDDIRPGN